VATGSAFVQGPLTIDSSTAVIRATENSSNGVSERLEVSGAISLPTTTSLTLDGTSVDANAVSGAITGAGSLIKSGSGRWRLASNSTIAATTVGAGEFELTGKITGPATIQGGTLSGTGTCTGMVTLSDSTAVVSPGGTTVGTLTFGGLTMTDAAATILVDINSTSDTILLAGLNAELNGNGIIHVATGSSTASRTVTIFSGAGSVNGQFNPTITAPSGFPNRYLTYTPTSAPTSASLVIDGDAPTVARIESVTANGVKFVGDTVTLQVVFSEPVTIANGATLTLTLNSFTVATPSTPRSLVITGTGAAATTDYQVSFQVTGGETTSPAASKLTVTALAVAGTITDQAGNTATISLPASNNLPGSLNNITFDNKPPTSVLTSQPAFGLNVRGRKSLKGFLEYTDLETPAAAGLNYKVLIIPSQGVLEKYDSGSGSWSTLAANGTFTQADLDNTTVVDGAAGFVRYRHTGSSGGVDAFAFKVIDPNDKESDLAVFNITISGTAKPTFNDLAATVTYVEGSGPAVVDGSSSVSDVDSSILYDTVAGYFSAQFISGATAEDRLSFSFSNTGAVSLVSGNETDGGTIAVSGTTIGTYSGVRTGSGVLQVTFNNNASPALVSTLLQNLTYQFTGKNPSSTARALRLAVTDGTVDSEASPTYQTVSISITAVNDPPVFTTPDPVLTVPGITLSGTVAATDPEGRLATSAYSIANPALDRPTQGTLALDAATGGFTYTAFASAAGTDRFAITASDQDGGTTRQEVSVVISASGQGELRFTSLPPFNVSDGAQVLYQPVLSATSGTQRFRLIGLNTSATLSFNQTTGVLNWNPVPIPSTTDPYYRFGILVTDSATQAAVWQPILLKVSATTGGNG
jgi:hypothetical protein